MAQNLVNMISHKPLKGISPNFGQDVFGFVVLISFWDHRSTSPGKQGEYYIFVINRANFTKIRRCVCLGLRHTELLIRSKGQLVKVTAGNDRVNTISS